MKRKPFICEICEAAFRDSDDLYDHRQDHHTREQRLPYTKLMAEEIFGDLSDGAWAAAMMGAGLDVGDLYEGPQPS